MYFRAPAIATILGLILPLAATVPAVAAAPTLVQAAAVSTAAPTFPAGVTRLSGATRYETAVAVSRQYAPGVSVAYVGVGSDFPDGLAAGPAAALEGGPLLLTQTTKLPDAVLAELKRLQPARITIVGGTGVVSSSVEASLKVVAPTTRLAGSDRYATAFQILAKVFDSADHAIVATGRTFPDALAAGGAAGSRRAPVVLVDGTRSSVPATVVQELERLGVTSVSIAGGTGAVSAGIQAQLTTEGYAVTRYGGSNRFETTAAINRAYFPAGSTSTTFLANGLNFPDALAAGALAGHLSAPVDLTPRPCVHPAVSAAIDEVGAPSRVVLGGAAVVAQAAAENVRCVYPVMNEPLEDWAVSGFALRADVAAPYADRPPVDVYDPAIKLDSTGLRVLIFDGQRYDHPVAYAQYGISALLEYQRTGTQVWIDRANRHAERLVQMRVEHDGAWWYPYLFDHAQYQRLMKARWWSGMAQGEALSLFVRMAEETGDPKWDTAADRTWTSLTQPYVAGQPWASLVVDDHFYIEEYAGNEDPMFVLNGHIFATFGLYDYWRRTGDPEVARYLDGAATSVLERMVPLVRVQGGVSYYCVLVEYCQQPRWQNQKYHVIHSWQLDTLARITGEQRFTEWADILRSDWQPSTFSTRGLEPWTDTEWLEPGPGLGDPTGE